VRFWGLWKARLDVTIGTILSVGNFRVSLYIERPIIVELGSSNRFSSSRRSI